MIREIQSIEWSKSMTDAIEIQVIDFPQFSTLAT